MKIIIDNSNLFAGGGIQVAISFLYDLIEQGHNHNFVVIQSYKIWPLLDEKKFPSNFQFVRLPKLSIYKKRREVMRLENEVKPDVIFSVFGPSYHKSNYPKIVGFAIPHLLYSNSPFFKGLSFIKRLKIDLISKIKLLAFELYSDILIFETEDAMKTYKSRYKTKKRCFVVSNTLNGVFYHKEKWVKKNIEQSASFNILSVTANYPHKNLQIIPSIIKILKNKFSWDDFKFILTVTKEEMDFDTETNDHIIFLGTVPLEEIPSLYEKSDVVFMPTLLEVFSTTYLEAMYMKKPIVASNMSFARDICGDSALYCSPLDAWEYSRAILQLKNNERLQQTLIDRGTMKLKQFGRSSDRTRDYLNIIEACKI